MGATATGSGGGNGVEHAPSFSAIASLQSGDALADVHRTNPLYRRDSDASMHFSRENHFEVVSSSLQTVPDKSALMEPEEVFGFGEEDETTAVKGKQSVEISKPKDQLVAKAKLEKTVAMVEKSGKASPTTEATSAAATAAEPSEASAATITRATADAAVPESSSAAEAEKAAKKAERARKMKEAREKRKAEEWMKLMEALSLIDDL